MTETQTSCSRCGIRFGVPHSALGTRVRCPRCGTGVVAWPGDESQPERAAPAGTTTRCPECGALAHMPTTFRPTIVCPGCAHEFPNPAADRPPPEVPPPKRRAWPRGARSSGASVLVGFAALFTVWVPAVGLWIAVGGLTLALVGLWRGRDNLPFVRYLGIGGAALSTAAVLAGTAVLGWRAYAMTPAAVARHGFWEASLRPEDVDRLVVAIESLRPEEVLYVDRSGRSVISRVSAAAFRENMRSDTFRPPGLSRPFVCMYRAADPTYRTPTRDEALALLRSRLDAAWSWW